MRDPLSAIPLSALRIFEAAARLRSFTRAAEELGVTQAAVSWQVKALERRLGQPLFRRLPREVALTAAGESLARASSEAMNLLRAALSDLSEQEEGVLSITTLQSFATQWLAPRIGAFQLAHPKIAVRLDTSSHFVDVRNEGVDVALRSGTGEWAGLESHYLFSSAVTPLCAPGLKATLGGLAAPADLLTAPLIGAHEEWSDWFVAAGVTTPLARTSGRLIADLQTIEVGSALAGQGVALGSPMLYAPEIAQGRLVRPFQTSMAVTAGYWLAYARDRHRAPKIAAFRDWLMRCIAEDGPELREAGG